MAGLFSILSVGVRGMTSQQGALSVTSHNIANANTDGYTRQRALIQATKPFGGTDKLSVEGAGQQGTGAEVSTIQRVRDSFIDYQVRSYTTTQGQYIASEKYLSQVQSVFNEPSDTGVSKLLTKFFADWQTLSTSPSSEAARNTVATDSATLADELNNSFDKLQGIQTQINTSIQADVTDINTTLDQINSLNKQIKLIKIGGNEPNDLMDKRDSLLDKLSAKLGINIDKKSYYGEDVTPVVQTDSASALGVNDPFNNLPTNAANPGGTTALVSSDPKASESRFSYINSIVPATSPATSVYTITYYKNGDTSKASNMVQINVDLGTTAAPATTATAAVVAQRLQQITNNRVMWANSDGVAVNGDGTKALTDNTASATPYNFNDLKMLQTTSGELVGYTSAKEDTDKYIGKLNSLAKGLAFSVNAIQSGYTKATGASATTPAMLSTNASGVALAQKDYLPFFVNSDKTVYDSSNNLTGTALDTALANEQNITAGNISINKSIMNNVMLIKTKTHDDEFANTADNNIDGTGDGARAKMIADLQNNLLNYANIGGTAATSIQTRSDMFDITTKGGNVLLGLNFQNSPQGMTTSNYFKSVVNSIATQEQTATRTVSNLKTTLDVFNQNKQSVSGVSLDEEMANMVQFNHAYQANAKIISTIDSLLDVVINGLKK